jgi:hypothetical protein
MINRRIYASQNGALLDSDVYLGGGSDDTVALQSLLDKALEWGRLHLVLDGAARISKSLKVHSNTTIECPDKSCGLFLSDGANCCVITNANHDLKEIHDRNITLLGGVFNNNSPGQVHHREEEEEEFLISNWVYGMLFIGVEHVILRDVIIANQRTFALHMINWKHVLMENIHIDRRERADHQNQDGLHFWGPGRFLTLRNIRGNSGDDFIALAPDEHDFESSIEDVLIDGVHLNDADQGIRLLSKGEGRLDRVVIKNVTGTYRSYGFIINPWFEGPGGRYGNIIFDTIDLRPLKNNYNYSPPFLFKLGGRIESLSVRNLYHHCPEHDHCLFVIGGHYGNDHSETDMQPTHINRLLIEGLYVDEQIQAGLQASYMRLKSRVDTMIIKDCVIRRSAELGKSGSLLRIEDNGNIGELRIRNISAPAIQCLVEGSLDVIESKSFSDID